MTKMNKWISVNDRLPTEEGWYLVWAPERWDFCKTNKKVDGGYMFSKFSPTHKIPWSLDCEYRKLVKYWCPLPEKPEK